MDRYLTVRQVANIFGRHPRTIYRWLTEGTIRGIQIKSRWYIPPEEVKRIFEQAKKNQDIL